jgi:hypothetical protein
MIISGRAAVQLYLEANRCPLPPGPQIPVEVEAVNRNVIVPGADWSVAFSAPTFHDTLNPH